MRMPLEINDWGLIEELRTNAGPLIVTVVDRLVARHGAAARRMGVLSRSYADATFRLIDVAENPSLKRILRFRRLPGVVVFYRGEELRRWQGRVQTRWVESALSELIEGGDPI